ncbi:MAG: TIGR02584 family CRISPR-associated protein [Oleispira sp.]|nr:TIGR02584 family CRISPR-associated protein [Oleispira sp.]
MKNILLAAMGTSPQVLTETLYAIHMQGKPFPDEVYLITSANAKAKTVEWLFEKGQIEHLKAHHNLPDFKFELSHILLMEHDSGEAVFDGREEDDQKSIADSITRIVTRFTADENCRIHASIAGGRKTMAFYLGYAMSMFGRDQDILSHVFVTKEFEFTEQFFFPTLNDNHIAKNDQVLNTKDAQVTLAEIPFVRMRNMIDKSLIAQIESDSFSKTVARLNAYKQENIKVQVASKAKNILVNGIVIKLPPKELAFYLWLSQLPGRKIDVTREFCENSANSASYLKTYSLIASDSRVFASFNVDDKKVEDLSEEELSELPELKAFSKEWLQQARSKINKEFKGWLDTAGADAVSIVSDEYNTKLHEVRYSISEALVVEHDL